MPSRSLHAFTPFMFALTGLLTLSACQDTSPTAQAQNSPIETPNKATTQSTAILFENVTILTLDDEQTRSGQSVLVENDRIIKLGPSDSLQAPAGVVRIDGTGRYLMPGMTEMHGHIPPTIRGRQAVEDTLFLYISNGVTTVRGMLGSPGQLDLRERAKSGDLLSPTLYLAGPSFNGNSVSSPQQAKELVNAQYEQGWDLLKVHPGLSLEEYTAMAETAQNLNMAFSGHIPADVGLGPALDMTQDTIDHIDGYIDYLNAATTEISEADIREIAKKTKAANVAIVPTMAVWETLLRAAPLEERQNFEELKYIDQSTRQNWTNFYTGAQRIGFLRGSDGAIRQANRLKLLKVLHEEGVEILFGTDAPQAFSVPGFSIHREIASMREAGLKAQDILISATRATGAHFAHKDKFGLIEIGHRADLILLDQNPLTTLETLKTPYGVMVRGKWLSRQDINNRLGEIEVRHTQ